MGADQRLVLGEGPRVWFLLNPNAVTDPVRRASGGVGFPREDCFVWDVEAFNRLTDVYARTGATDASDWHGLIRFTAKSWRDSD